MKKNYIVMFIIIALFISAGCFKKKAETSPQTSPKRQVQEDAPLVSEVITPELIKSIEEEVGYKITTTPYNKPGANSYNDCNELKDATKITGCEYFFIRKGSRLDADGNPTDEHRLSFKIIKLPAPDVEKAQQFLTTQIGFYNLREDLAVEGADFAYKYKSDLLDNQRAIRISIKNWVFEMFYDTNYIDEDYLIKLSGELVAAVKAKQS